MTVKTKIAQPQAFSKIITAAMTASRARSAGYRRGVIAGRLSTGHPPREAGGQARRAALPPRTVTVAHRQATGLIPVGGFTVAGQRRAFTGLRCRCTAAA